jgi:competence protein ComFB
MRPLRGERVAAFMVKNANYDLVLSAVDKLLNNGYTHVCSCSRCRSDMTALALNYLPPHYYTETERSKAFGSPWVMIENAVIEAIERVADNPYHNGKGNDVP